MASTASLLCVLCLVVVFCAADEPCSKGDIVEEYFGNIGKTPVKRYTFANDYLRFQIITYGARISSLEVPDRNGKFADVVLGFDNLKGYLGQNPYFGAIQGRVGNRIAGANFTIDGETYYLVPNDKEKHSLSGGVVGFDKRIWEPYVKDNKLILSYLSKDGENFFPGTVLTQVTYEANKNVFCFSARAYVTKKTPLNILNHAHFNLAGQDAGPEGMYGHYFSINADKYTELNSEEIPTGRILPVEGTVFDLRRDTNFGEIKKKIDGFDHNYCINVPEEEEEGGLHYVGRAYHPDSGRVVLIFSTQPGVQFYTGPHLPERGSSNPLFGKGETEYVKDGAFFMEPQHYPDGLHHSNFPDMMVTPDKPYYCKTCYEFYTMK